MKGKLTYLFIYVFINLNGIGQINLVPNPSFEDTLGECDIQMFIGPLGSKIKNWYTCYYGSTPDCYNTCANSIMYPTISSVPYSCRTYQMPHTGQAFIGLWAYQAHNALDSSNIESENIAVKLNTSLKANACYYGEFYANLGNISNLGINQISMLLSTNIYTATAGNFTNTIQPQVQWDTTQYFTDTLNWVKISAKFKAQGGEKYLTIGNFKDGTHLKKTFIGTNFIPGGCAIIASNRFYINIDDVNLYEIPKPQLGTNVEYCQEADSILIGDNTLFGNEFKWYANGQLIDTLHKQIKIKPTVNTTYILQNGGCAADTLIVTFKSCPLPELPIEVVEPIIPNVFTPNNDSINDVWRFYLGKGNSLKSLNIYNRWGNEIVINSRSTVTQINWDGRTTSGEETSSGVYFYVLQYTDANSDEHKKNGYITLIR